MKKKLVSLLLGTMIMTAIAGCTLFGSNNTAEEDVLTTISVKTEDLAPEVQEEVKKSKDELWTVEKAIPVGSRVYVKIVPGKLLEDNGLRPITLYLNDANYIQAMVDAKEKVYIDLSPIEINEKDALYTEISEYLRSLDNSELIETVRAATEEFGELPAEEPTSEPISEFEEVNPQDQEDKAPEEGTKEAKEEPSEEPAENANQPEVSPDGPDPLDIFEQVAEGKTGEDGVYLSNEDLAALYQQYFSVHNFAAAKTVTLYDTDCNYLGVFSAYQLQSYNCAKNGETAPYTIVGGSVKASDLLDDITYTATGIDMKNGSFDFRYKNDTAKAQLLFVASESKEVVIPLFNRMFSVTGYYPKGEWDNQGIDTKYNFRVLSFENDEAMVTYMEENGMNVGLKLSTVQPNEKGKYIFDSSYDYFYNDLGKEVQLTSDTKNVEHLSPDKAIGVAKDKQESFTMIILEEDE